jgi:hypothetical protein
METNELRGFQDRMDEIVASALPDVEKLKQGFGLVTEQIIDYAQHEIELARALHDDEGRVKTQVKMSTMKWAREIFDTWYTRITGRRAWDE